MFSKPLLGKRVAIVVESKFIPEEIAAYRSCFGLLGASVDFISRIWYGDYKPGHKDWSQPVFLSDIDPSDQEPWESSQRLLVDEKNDVTNIVLDDYAAVIMTANYVSVRLRYSDQFDAKNATDFVQSAPAVRFFADAMKNPNLVKGALCHGLWILAPHPELLAGRRVTCHTVVMADILNAGADIVFEETAKGIREPAKVVVDGDLVTGFSKQEVIPFVEAIAKQIAEINPISS